MIKKFLNWLSEDFAQVGTPPAGNVTGMGNPTPPTSTSTGSGDAWPSLGAPYSLVPLKKRRKRKKRAKKLNEKFMDPRTYFKLLEYLNDEDLQAVAKELKDMSPKKLDPKSFGEHLEDLSRNPEEYDIDTKSSFYRALEVAWNEISVKRAHAGGHAVPPRYASWDKNTVEDSKIYKAYCSLFK